jgi:hypothetical protein
MHRFSKSLIHSIGRPDHVQTTLQSCYVVVFFRHERSQNLVSKPKMRLKTRSGGVTKADLSHMSLSFISVVLEVNIESRFMGKAFNSNFVI